MCVCVCRNVPGSSLAPAGTQLAIDGRTLRALLDHPGRQAGRRPHTPPTSLGLFLADTSKRPKCCYRLTPGRKRLCSPSGRARPSKGEYVLLFVCFTCGSSPSAGRLWPTSWRRDIKQHQEVFLFFFSFSPSWQLTGGTLATERTDT